MKRSILYIAGLCVLLLLGGCGTTRATELPADAASTRAPVSRPVLAEPIEVTLPESEPADEFDGEDEEGRILGHCISIREDLPCAVDLDGDGEDEVVDLILLPTETDDSLRWTVSVTKGREQKRFQTDILNDMPYDLWVGDLDEDGRYEIFFHGDAASDDYLIYAFRSDMSLLFFEPDDRFADWEDNEGESNVFAGRIEGFEDGHIVIEGIIDMLGTHWGVRNYAIGDDGVIGPVSSVWAFDEPEDRFLTVTRTMTAYRAAVRRDPGEAFTLEPGDRICTLASDGFERMWFETERGREGVLILVRDEENTWLIDGVPEEDCFEFLPYSG